MNRVRGKGAVIVAGACLAAMLVAVPSAEAAVTQSNITSPKDLSYFVYQYNTPNIFAVSGMSNGTTSDHLDVRCYHGNTSTPLVTGVGITANGTFSVNGLALGNAQVRAPCRLRAVPAGTTPANVTPFAGPRILASQNRTYSVSGGPNNGHLYDFYYLAQQLSGAFDYDSLYGCGVDDGYLSNPTTFAETTRTFYCNEALFYFESGSVLRSEIQIDGANAYPTSAAERINANATGLPVLSYKYSVSHKNGDVVIHETEALVKCTNATYPPTNVTCPKFVGTGVTDHRTITQDHSGRMAWVTDVFTSTDRKSHKLDLLWDNDQRFYEGTGDSTQIEYKFPGKSSYSTHVVNDVVSLPKSPGTIFIRMHGAPDGDTSTGRGAIVYDRPATAATFRYVDSSYEAFMLHQKVTVPAHGTTRLRFAVAQEYQAAKVAADARLATAVFAGCTVPNVVGKSLAAAKRAIKKAHCTVGRIKHASSSTIARGVVVAEQPAAGTHVDYGTKVAVIVSKG